MKVLRVVSALVLTLGLFFLFFGLALFFTLERNMQLMEELQRAGMGREIDIPVFRSIIVESAALYVMVGMLSVIGGIGMLFRKNWARRLWLAVLVFTALMGIYSVVMRLWRGTLDTADIIGFTVTGLLIAAMWLYFTRPKTKTLFEHVNKSPVVGT